MRIEDAINERPSFLTPKDVLTEIGVKEGDIVVDYGSGCGHWAIPAAKVVGQKGKVYAIDDNISILQVLRGRADIQKLINIEIEELNLEKEDSTIEVSADFIIVSNVLHLIKNKEKFVKRLEKLLSPQGQVLVVDWTNCEKTLFGPEEKLRVCEEEVISLFENADYHFCHTVDAGWHHFGLVFDGGGRSAKRQDK